MTRERKRLSPYLLKLTAVVASLLTFSCSLFEKKPAVLWTDTPEMLVAAELFNASQDRHLMEVHYVDRLSEALRAKDSRDAKNPRGADARGEAASPSLVVGSGLRARSLADSFQSLEYLFGELVLSKSAFYPSLLKGGVEDGRQLLVPVSFNLLLVLNAKTGQTSGEKESTDIAMDEIERRAKAFATGAAGRERMGFSPRWPDKDFLFQWIQLNGANFAESAEKNRRKGENGEFFPVVWNPTGLEYGVSLLRNYVLKVDGSAQAEDAFAFRYLFGPGYKNVEDGRVLFAAIKSSDFFTLPPARRAGFEYRYFSEGGRLAMSEGIKYAGIPLDAPNKEAAEQFLRWFFAADHQKEILEKSRTLRLSESAFGIAGGFSSLQSVTESLFPSYYTDLAGRTPPEKMVVPPEPLPSSWARLKSEVILPWLDETSKEAQGAGADGELAARLEAYLDRNPDLR